MRRQLLGDPLCFGDGGHCDSVTFVNIPDQLNDSLAGCRLVCLLLIVEKGWIDLLPSRIIQRLDDRPQGSLVVPLQ